MAVQETKEEKSPASTTIKDEIDQLRKISLVAAKVVLVFEEQRGQDINSPPEVMNRPQYHLKWQEGLLSPQ